MRIIIADDHALFRGGLRLQLAELAQDADIREAGTLDDAERVLSDSGAADVLLMDLDLPGMSWRDCVVDLRTQYPDMRLVVVSGDDRSETIREAMAIGVHGYIPKQEQPDVFCAALQLVLRGGSYFPAAIVAGLTTRPIPEGNNAAQPQRPAAAANLQSVAAPSPQKPSVMPLASHPLTDRQMDVLALMSEGLSNKGIARQLGVTEGTVKLHVAAILRNLGAANRTQAVTLAREVGVLAS